MDKTCPLCFHKGKPKFIILDDYKPLLLGLFLGFAFFLISIEAISFENPGSKGKLYIIHFIFFCSIALLLFLSYYTNNKDRCPKCYYGHLDETRNL